MKLLITGGCGFIGSNFIRHIFAEYPNYKIINLDKLTYAGNLENLKDIEKNNNYEFIKGDVADSVLVQKLVNKVDLIVNFAAESHVDRSIKDPDDFLRTNIFGTHILLKAALQSGKKMLHISTDEVYGSIEEGSFSETSSLEPNSPYSASKASADLLCMAYHATYGLPVTIARSSNNFGPYQYPEKVIPLFITNLIEGKKVPLYGDGKNVRDWIFVLDNCRAIDIVLHKGKPGEIYNIASGTEVRNIELTNKLLELLGRDDSFIEYVEDRKGHDRRYSLETKKIRSLGWSPQHNFEKALNLTIEWYKNNNPWWERLK